MVAGFEHGRSLLRPYQPHRRIAGLQPDYAVIAFKETEQVDLARGKFYSQAERAISNG